MVLTEYHRLNHYKTSSSFIFQNSIIIFINYGNDHSFNISQCQTKVNNKNEKCKFLLQL